MKSLVAGLLSVFLLAGTATAAAQEVEDPSEKARFRWGPIRFTPTLIVSNLGRDSNVFNEADDPKDDFTAAVGPGVRVWMRPLRSRLSLQTGGQYLFFKDFTDQRSWNTSNDGRWEFPLARITPFIGGTYVNTRDRQGFEIDSRSRRLDRSVNGGTSLRISGKTAFVVSYRRLDIEYDDREAAGVELARALDRQEEAAKVQMRYALTPLTTFVVDAEVGRDRFDTATIRDSDSVRVMPGFELKPDALISGSVFVGFRRFDPKSALLPDYSGVVAAVRATYVRTSTRYDLAVDRDLAYSFQESNPYYALLNTGLKITQRVTQRWDIVGQGSLQRLAYRQLEPLPGETPAGPPDAARTDRGFEYGGGLGFRLSDTVRLGLDAVQASRRSSVGSRRYEATRVFGSITYGLQQ